MRLPGIGNTISSSSLKHLLRIDALDIALNRFLFASAVPDEYHRGRLHIRDNNKMSLLLMLVMELNLLFNTGRVLVYIILLFRYY